MSGTEADLQLTRVADDREAALLEAFRRDPDRVLGVATAMRDMPKGLTMQEQAAYLRRAARPA